MTIYETSKRTLARRRHSVPGPDQFNQTGELAGILVALQSSPITAELTIVTDSQYAIKTLTRSLPNFEDAGWANVPNARWLQAAAYQLRRRGAQLILNGPEVTEEREVTNRQID